MNKIEKTERNTQAILSLLFLCYYVIAYTGIPQKSGYALVIAGTIFFTVAIPFTWILFAILKHFALKGKDTKKSKSLWNYALFIAWVIVCFRSWIFIYSYRLWPLSLRQGPDSGYAIQGLRQQIPSVNYRNASNIYYHARKPLSKNKQTLLKFQSYEADIETVRISLGLTNDPLRKEEIITHRKEKWWLPFDDVTSYDFIKTLECYSAIYEGSWKMRNVLWYQKTNSTFYYFRSNQGSPFH